MGIGCKTSAVYGNLDPLRAVDGLPPAVVLRGWAYSASSPKAGMSPLLVRVTVDGKWVASITANASRSDLVNAGATPSSNHGFTFGLPSSLCIDIKTGKHKISATVILSGTSSRELNSSPQCLCNFVPCACDSDE